MKNKLEYIFPCILILLQFGASMVYLAKGDFRMFINFWEEVLNDNKAMAFKV